MLVLLSIGFAAAPSSSSAAQISIINGKPTTIGEWPWQVALTGSQKVAPQATTRARFFCGGSLLTPELVITAGHCVADLKPRQIKRIEIVGGRTHLNDETKGTVVGVKELLMPLRADGKRRYKARFGVADWDVALLRLKSPIDTGTIKLAGEDEAASWSPGQMLSTTGWGVTGPDNRKSSNVLRVARQVMLPDSVCRKANGRVYRKSTMNCIGAPSSHASTCFGDSGGPLVAPVGTEYRLVGLTSFGDSYCRPALPSVDTRIAGAPMRRWVQDTVIELTGIDPIGSGGVAPPPREWCRVPDVYGSKPGEARSAVTAAGCRVSQVKRTKVRFGRKGRVVGSSFFPGWLAPVGTGIKIYVKR